MISCLDCRSLSMSPPGRGIWPRDDEPQLWGLAAVTQILALPLTSWVTLGKLFNISVFSSTKQSLVVRSKRLDTCKTPVQCLAHSKYSINASYYFYHYHQHYYYFIVSTDLLTWLLEEGKHQIQSRNLNWRQRQSLESNKMGLRMRWWFQRESSTAFPAQL